MMRIATPWLTIGNLNTPLVCNVYGLVDWVELVGETLVVSDINITVVEIPYSQALAEQIKADSRFAVMEVEEDVEETA